MSAFAKLIKAQRVLALTATAEPDVVADICEWFAVDPIKGVFKTGNYRENLTIQIRTCFNYESKVALLVPFLKSRKNGADKSQQEPRPWMFLFKGTTEPVNQLKKKEKCITTGKSIKTDPPWFSLSATVSLRQRTLKKKSLTQLNNLQQRIPPTATLTSTSNSTHRKQFLFPLLSR